MFGQLGAKRNRIIILGSLAFFFCLLVNSPAFAAIPKVGIILPSSGSTAPNIAKTFTATYSDSDGYANISQTYLLISVSASALANAAYLYYDQNANKLYLRNDSDTVWLGGYAPGSNNIIENSHVLLNCLSSSVSGSSGALTVKYNLSFKPSYSGKKYNTYLKVIDDTGNSAAWTRKGTYNINYPPKVGVITPSSGAAYVNVPLTLAAAYSDQDGWQNIQYAYFLINTSTSGSNCFYAYYNQNTNKLYLRNNANTAWLGGYASGSSNVIENSYAKLNCAATTVSGVDNGLTINWQLTFKNTFLGSKNCYLRVIDDVSGLGGWLNKGSLSILQDTTPPTGTVSINTASPYTNTQSVTLTLFAEDNPGGSGLAQMQFSNDNTNWSAPEGYVSAKSWTLLSGEGEKTVYARFSDLSGNWSEPYSDTITLDTIPPAIIIASPKDGSTFDTETITLSGTIDGVSFSESRTLAQEGANVVAKTATDEAGNSNSASITVYLERGQLIGPEGGEVASADGKVKVVIPEGALFEPTRIRVLNIDQDSLKDNAPQNSSLLSAVECLPYGLVFNKPVSIIYTLTQAEIPGTPVELGLYDAIQDIITPTGQTSTVPADGYTLTFSIMHFSTYAALKNLTPQSTPVGLGVKIPLPDLLTGSYAHSIPLTVVPGRKGMQPSLGLSYRSSSSNSWLGLGFSLNPGCITRSTRLGPPSYNDAKDTFYFITESGTTELVHLIDNLYQAKVESSFSKFFKEPDDSWKVVTKEGAVLRFGQSAESKENSPLGAFAWYLTKVTDTNGNYISYGYTKDQGKSYLSRIDYTGNEIGISPTNSVTFILEPREDVGSSYISSSKIATAKRLKEIQVKLGLELVWKYLLEYGYSPDTNRSLLKSITQYAGDNKALPVQRFSYQEAR